MVGAPGATALIVNACVTGAAAAKFALPAWVAVMLQLPAVTMVMFRPLTVQTPVVVEFSVTVKPELAVAAEANGVVLKAFAPGLANVMVCAAAAMVSVTAWVAAGFTPLVAVTVKLEVPATVGVPDNTPVVGFRFKPVGNVPTVTEKVGAGAPLAVNVWE